MFVISIQSEDLTVLINAGRLRPRVCKKTKGFFVNRKATTRAGLNPTCVYFLLPAVFYF